MKSLAAARISGKHRMALLLLLPALALLVAPLIAGPMQAHAVSESECTGSEYAWSGNSCVVLNSVLIMATSDIDLSTVQGGWTTRYSHSIGSITVINATRSGNTTLAQLNSQMDTMRSLSGVISVEYDALVSHAGTAAPGAVQTPDNDTGAVVTSSNSPASGDIAVNGPVWAQQTLTADTSAISDSDGLVNVAFSYQWFADDAKINGADDAAYTLRASDANKTIKVRVTFTDDAGNSESLTSTATSSVQIGGL